MRCSTGSRELLQVSYRQHLCAAHPEQGSHPIVQEHETAHHRVRLWCGPRFRCPLLSLAVPSIDFYKRAFNAKEKFRMADPNGGVGHAEIQIGNSMIMLANCPRQFHCNSSMSRKGSFASSRTL
jgi:hypothetical protein